MFVGNKQDKDNLNIYINLEKYKFLFLKSRFNDICFE